MDSPHCYTCGGDGLVDKMGVSGVVTDYYERDGMRFITGIDVASISALVPDEPCDCDAGWALRLREANADDGGWCWPICPAAKSAAPGTRTAGA